MWCGLHEFQNEAQTIALDCTRELHTHSAKLVLIIYRKLFIRARTSHACVYELYLFVQLPEEEDKKRKTCFASIYCTCFETQIALMTIIYICICKYRQYNGNLVSKGDRITFWCAHSNEIIYKAYIEIKGRQEEEKREMYFVAIIRIVSTIFMRVVA